MRLEDLERRARMGDVAADIELHKLRARAGSRPHLETLSLYEHLLDGDPLLGDAAFEQAVERYKAVADVSRSRIARTLGAASTLQQLYDAAVGLDLTIKVHWRGLHGLERDHTVVGEFALGARTAQVSAPVAEVVACLERERAER